MWGKTWGYREGLAIGLGLFITGVSLQALVGEIGWEHLAWPRNAIAGSLFLAILLAIHVSRRRVYLFSWLSSQAAAVSSLVWVGGLTVIMGFVMQRPAGHPHSDWLGFTQMVRAWPYVLLYLWMVTTLGLAILRTPRPRRWRHIPFWLNHLGLFIALLCAVLGNADMLRLRMTCQVGKPEWRAQTPQGELMELPLAIELKSFIMDLYPPKLMVIDNATGHVLPEGQPHHVSLDDTLSLGRLLDWDVRILEAVPMAGSVVTEDTIRFVSFHSMGATYAALVEAVHRSSGRRLTDWVSCGSFVFPHKPMRLDSATSIVMPEREPRRFTSEVTIYTQAQEILQASIEVNRPLEIAGWKIYQLSYDETKGPWSDISVLELVRDPWLPFVYLGIAMMMLGSLGLFLNAQRQDQTQEDSPL